MGDPIDIGYFLSDIRAQADKDTLQSIITKFSSEIEFIGIEAKESSLTKVVEDNHLDFLMIFEDHTLLSKTNEAEVIPPVIIVELPGSHVFFSSIRLDQLSRALQLIIKSQYIVSERELLAIKFANKTELALNDFYLTSTYTNSRIRFELTVQYQETFETADSSNGVLISTPTGSTAMAMNLGGSLLLPDASTFQIQSIASRNFLIRQVIVSSDAEITIEVLDANFPLFIQIDSRTSEIDVKTISITKSEFTIKMVELNLVDKEDLQHKLTQKLTLEATSDLTSSAKFILHVLQQADRGMKINEIMEITHLTNQKTVRNSLKLLIDKGFIGKQDNLDDMREHLYFLNNYELSRYYS